MALSRYGWVQWVVLKKHVSNVGGVREQRSRSFVAFELTRLLLIATFVLPYNPVRSAHLSSCGLAREKGVWAPLGMGGWNSCPSLSKTQDWVWAPPSCLSKHSGCSRAAGHEKIYTFLNSPIWDRPFKRGQLGIGWIPDAISLSTYLRVRLGYGKGLTYNGWPESLESIEEAEEN